jgi:RHS repeat-associated protein
MFSQTDNVRQKYVGMEQDDATGLNHTLWRKDDSLSGRWTSPDPYGASLSTADPQSFNRYVYCGNDPINHTDPTGLIPAHYHEADSGWDEVGGYFWDPTGVGRTCDENDLPLL